MRKHCEKKCYLGPLSAKERNEKAFTIRYEAAEDQRNAHLSRPVCNGDEWLYPKKIANFSKGLPHNSLGEVDMNSYNRYIKALNSGKVSDFNSIPMGGPVKLSNPQAAYALDLIGSDSHKMNLAVPPTFSSAWQAGEMAEVYWQALTRDVSFSEYSRNPLTKAAAAELSRLSDFRGPKSNGEVTTETLFRGNTPGDLAGPYISQFLWKDIPFGAKTITQQYRTTLPDSYHLTSYDAWLNIQNGGSSEAPKYDLKSRYIRNGRDLSAYVHQDFSYQGPLSACLILLSFGKEAIAQTNPYMNSATEGGFVTFGAAHILDLVAKVTRAALEAAWCQKFLIHRRLRPEEFGGRVHNHLTGETCYPFHKELLESQVVQQTFKQFGTYLLPMAYPEGCPTHPAYPAGHACLAGAGATVLKAFFNENFHIPNPVEANSDGLSLIPYGDTPLTIGGELNKLASNIALGRDTAGVHWRSDGIEGLKLGETVAIEILKDYSKTYNERFCGFTLTKFDGTTITIK
ncbi:vanadium-dependent haloperoxidase [Mesobacillus subterraneus]|uniref:vanadium-dependent haloperoxidase n=1 Tax=Mesobacillus subterraneus TaxID=285983 RepID=UPI0020402BB4|nr:vanadium-dependent haloperoxidase [Mesobacillus subterraneus]MCM3665078.1 vanadium-dependent haloperoxidase [Mesobacillus subterraneus]MCM3684092.1 vanadium-dependent haloperoxidase [Mesobacillus subterraneus]